MSRTRHFVLLSAEWNRGLLLILGKRKGLKGIFYDLALLVVSRCHQLFNLYDNFISERLYCILLNSMTDFGCYFLLSTERALLSLQWLNFKDFSAVMIVSNPWHVLVPGMF